MSKCPMVRLGDVCKILSGFAFDSRYFTNEERGMPLIRIRDVMKGNTSTYYSGDYEKKYIIKHGDYLIGMDGEFNLAEWKGDDALLNQRVCKIVAKSEVINNRFLLYFLPRALKEIEDKTSFVTVKHLSTKSINAIIIPLPPIEVQKKIAQTVDAAAELIALRKKQLAELDNLVKAVFYDMFGDPVVNEKGWERVEFGTLGEWNSGGTPTRTNRNYFVGDIDWYSAGELNQRYLIQSKEKVTVEAIKNSAAKIFKNRSMLIGMYDTAAFKLGILTKDSASNQACANVRVNAELANVEWLYDCAQIMRPFFLENRRGIRQKNLNLGMIKSFRIPLPPLTLQNQFAAIVAKIEGQKALVRKAVDESQYLFDSLMGEYFG